jgi:hypothetical protein
MEISDEGLHKFGDGTLSRVSIGLFGIEIDKLVHQTKKKKHLLQNQLPSLSNPSI